jgi:predicted ATPase
LESLIDPRHVAGAVAASLGLELKSRDSDLELVDLVRSRKLLIILDSCEHVIEAVALLAEQLHQETEQIYLLTTSRELLKVRGEHCYRVPRLDYPPEGSEQTANAVLRYSYSQKIDSHHATEHRSTDQSRNGCGMRAGLANLNRPISGVSA